uniref:Cathepsin H n=1 Tax=Suberites domuncula TaxID=55567 RepID=Q6A1I1_SUBDO|nr:cathepsin H [Suberites domuncula]
MSAMKLFLGLCVLVHVCSAFIPLVLPIPGLYEDYFKEWQEKHGKVYSTEEESQSRLKVFMKNVIYIDNHNKQGHSYELEVNEYADMTLDEFKDQYLMEPQHCSATHSLKSDPPKYRDPPKAIDWRSKGAVTPVKNQGQCGSCWTFSTTGCLESHHFLKTGQLVSLSEQQLVDCAQAFNNNGCNGGLPSQAFEYIHYNGGLDSEESYPYRAHDEKCHFVPSEVSATVSNVVNITSKDEMQLYNAVGTVGPVSIAYDVSADFRFYKKGVYKSKECKTDPEHVNHAVLAVGYNTTESGEDYWIVKNSWGTKFGINGYFWIARGENMCGLADCASYPIV